MVTILLQQIIDFLNTWVNSWNSHAQTVAQYLGLIEEDTSNLPDIKSNTDDIKDNTAAVITPINNIKSNTDSIVTSSSTTASNTTVIKNNIGTIATNTGSAAAFAEDCANNTLDIKDKVTTIASDTTQIRADHVELENDLDKIYNAIKWSCLDIETTETESGASPISFDTDIADDLISCNVGIVATQSGSGDPSPDNIRTITGYSSMGLTVNGSSVTIALGDTYYGGVLDVISGKLSINMMKDTMTSSYLSGLSSSYIGFVNSVGFFNNHPAIWVRNWKTPPACAGRRAGGIKSLCNAFNITMNNNDIISTQFRIYFDVNNLNISSVSDFITTIQNMEITDPLEICYEIETPIEIQLTAQQLAAIKGINTITSDTNGNIEVTYKESVKHYLDKHDA